MQKIQVLKKVIDKLPYFDIHFDTISYNVNDITKHAPERLKTKQVDIF